jgi:hypothetical protein
MKVSIAAPRLRDRIAAWLLASAWRGLLLVNSLQQRKSSKLSISSLVITNERFT